MNDLPEEKKEIVPDNETNHGNDIDESSPGKPVAKEEDESETAPADEGPPAETGEVEEKEDNEIEQDIEPGKPEEKELVHTPEISDLLAQNFEQLADKIDPSQISAFLADDVKILLQSFYNKIIDRLEDPKGFYAYKSQSSLLKGLIGIYDLLKELENSPWKPGEEVHAKNYKAVATQLLQVFLMHDLDPVSPSQGDSFNPRLHRAVGVEETSNLEEDSTVSKCIRVGFVFQEVVVRPAEVKIKKYVKPEEAGEDRGETTEDG